MSIGIGYGNDDNGNRIVMKKYVQGLQNNVYDVLKV
jgi:hypothetical protein